MGSIRGVPRGGKGCSGFLARVGRDQEKKGRLEKEVVEKKFD